MDAQVQAAWINDLRSGAFPQCTGTLHNQDGYCCLGVGAQGAFGMHENVVMALIIVDDEGDEYDESLDEFTCEYINDEMRGSQMDAFDEETCAMLGIDQGVHDFLTRLNDTWGWTFDEIADFLDGRDLTIAMTHEEREEQQTINHPKGY